MSMDSHVCLVLDVWSVHKSEELRRFLRTHHSRIHLGLVFVPANCTSKLQLADVMLQRPFKHDIKKRFNEWAAAKVKQQVDAKGVVRVGLNQHFKMVSIKPLVLQWCIHSWTQVKSEKEMIVKGWDMCCVSLFDVHSPEQRAIASKEVIENKLEFRGFIPIGDEAAEKEESDEEDEDKDVLDIMKERAEPARKGTCKRSQAEAFGFQLSTSQIALTEDSE
jgi:hypothetical protein